ncbi:MAG: CAP domain-containing protein [Bauldia sp.]|uniref:CAP domain-containing protein n=1 Tax=Bauldia sp. TaxID=2575872 RepID=UPI001DBBC859|nr:CAP domain-containing protein [Bauldia sp.]MCB1494667.1 CAP domain-containing protein [Bauldia sp.]
MDNMVVTRRGALRVVSLVLVSGPMLSACASLFDKPDELIKGAGPPSPATVNPGSAAAEISSYRKARGLSAVSLNGQLMGIARSHSDAMARADKMSHVVRGEGSFQQRLSRGGYDAAIAVENVAAGHRTFNEAFAGWKASRGHNANLLKPGVTQMGIAVAFRPNSKYGNFWTLILAEPDNRHAALGPDGGRPMAVAG